MLAIRKKKQMEKKQRHAQDYCKIQMAESQKICHKDYITDLEAPLENPSTTIQSMMEPNPAHKLLLWRKEQCSIGKVDL